MTKVILRNIYLAIIQAYWHIQGTKNSDTKQVKKKPIEMLVAY